MTSLADTGSPTTGTSSRANFSLYSWVATWVCYATLVAQQVLDAFLAGAPWFIWAIKLVPLLLFLPGMLRDNLRSYIWLCFVSLGYFIIFVQRLFATPDSVLVIVGMIALVVLFIAAMLYVRWRARELRGDIPDSVAEKNDHE